jgi:hypothetical protein
MNAVGSVASLEWLWRIHEQNSFGIRPNPKGVSRVETISAKEDTEGSGCLGKPLGCRISDEQGIAVRTEWQSGNFNV